MRRLYVLGTVELEMVGADEGGTVLSGAKRLGVLLYLALARPHRLHRRDTLLPLFWPELDEPHARHALRQVIYGLRAVLGPEIVRSAGGDDLRFNPTALWVDALAFEEALAAGAPERALELYAGELAPGLHIDGADHALDEWLETKRASLRQRAADTARRLMRDAEARGDATAALHWARRLVEVDPHDGAGMRSLLSLLDAAGEGHQALAAYDAWAGRLEELGDGARDRQTQALVEAIRARLLPSRGRRVVAEGSAGGAGLRRAVSRVTPRAWRRRQRLVSDGRRSAVARVAHLTALGAVLAVLALGAVRLWPRPPDRLLVHRFVIDVPARVPIGADSLTRTVILALRDVPGLEIVVPPPGRDEVNAGSAFVRAAREAERQHARYYVVPFLTTTGGEARITAVYYDRQRPRRPVATLTLAGQPRDAAELASSLAIRLLTDHLAPQQR